MDISSAIVNIYKIEGLSMRDYKELVRLGKTSKYRIKLDTKKNGLLVQDLNNPRDMKMIKCICEYYSPTPIKQSFISNDCGNIKERILGDDGNGYTSCQSCHSICVNKIDSNELYKINNFNN